MYVIFELLQKNKVNSKLTKLSCNVFFLRCTNIFDLFSFICSYSSIFTGLRADNTTDCVDAFTHGHSLSGELL